MIRQIKSQALNTLLENYRAIIIPAVILIFSKFASSLILNYFTNLFDWYDRGGLYRITVLFFFILFEFLITPLATVLIYKTAIIAGGDIAEWRNKPLKLLNAANIMKIAAINFVPRLVSLAASVNSYKVSAFNVFRLDGLSLILLSAAAFFINYKFYACNYCFALTESSVKETVAASFSIMRGNLLKWVLFPLSFAGWVLLETGIHFLVKTFIGGGLDTYTPIIDSIVPFGYGIELFVTPYFYLAMSGFLREQQAAAKARAQKKGLKNRKRRAKKREGNICWTPEEPEILSLQERSYTSEKRLCRRKTVNNKNLKRGKNAKMRAEAVIFDKDGTLMEFDPFWVRVAESAVQDILNRLNINNVQAEEILEAFGVHNGVSDVNGILRKGTYEQAGEALCEMLERYGIKIETAEPAALVRETFSANSGAGEIKGCAGLKETLCRLKSLGIRLAVVTTDSTDITRKCLEGLGIEKFFDKIYTDDGKTPPKPEPYCAGEFLKAYGIKPENAVMVGDTLTDAKFAENAGMKFIAVASGAAGKELEDRAAAVIPDISGLDHIIEGRA